MQDVFSYFPEEKLGSICLHLILVGFRVRDNQLMLLFFRVIAGFLRVARRFWRRAFAGFAGKKMYEYEVFGV